MRKVMYIKKVVLLAMVLLICSMALIACGIKNSSDASSNRRIIEADKSGESKENEESKERKESKESKDRKDSKDSRDNKEIEEQSNIDSSEKASRDKVFISLQDGKLTVEEGSDKVELSKDGVLVNGKDGIVDVSLDGIHVKEGNHQVNIDASGIHVKDGLLGNTVDIDLSGLDIKVGGASGTFSLSSFLSKELPEIIHDSHKDINWNIFKDDVTLMRNIVTVEGVTKETKISIEDGYLVTMNCNEDTDISGLTLVKTETDEKGNVYRYYSE